MKEIGGIVQLKKRPCDLPVVKISPKWVKDPEQAKSRGRIATFSLWAGMLRDGISSIPRNRLHRVMKHYSPTDRRNHVRPLKRLVDT